MRKFFTILLASALVWIGVGCSTVNEDERFFEFLDGALVFDLSSAWVYDPERSEAETRAESNELHVIWFYADLYDANSQIIANFNANYNPYEGMTVPEFAELALNTHFPRADNPLDNDYETHYLFGDVPAMDGVRVGKWYTSSNTDGIKRFLVQMVLEEGFVLLEFTTTWSTVDFNQSFCTDFVNSLKLEKSYFAGDTTDLVS
jgi:hypothetical protein